MGNVLKLLLAVVLALAAAGLNAVWLTAEKRPPEFVMANADLPAGQTITNEMLGSIPVPGKKDTLSTALIPYANRAILLGLKTSRDYHRGDVFFQRDITAPRQLAEFEVLGPFKLISVGGRFTDQGKKDEVGGGDSAGNNITIAVSANFDERTRKLLQIVDPTRAAKDKTTRIIAIQVVPKEDLATSQLSEDKQVVYQTISLEGITNVPKVLLVGDVIRFVVPAHSTL
jgi:hypothetical protein